MKKSALYILAAMFVFSPHLSSRHIESDIVQIKLNRIYFSSGQEDGVKSGAEFIIACDGDEIISGVVEYAGPGISYSRPLSELDSLEIDSGCVARLATSRVDSLAIITIGTDMPIDFFDPEHETLFIREGDTVIPNLVDSTRSAGNVLEMYLSHGIRFSDGSQFNAEALAACLIDIKNRSRSYLCRYFFSKLMPAESNGIEMVDGYTLRLRFYHPFPRAAYYLSHPDFAVYSSNGRGTGPLAQYPDPEGGLDQRVFAANRHYRGKPPAFSKVIIRYYEQQYRIKFAYENNQIDAYFGFGFEADLAGSYEAKALYPEIAVMIAGIGGELFSQTLFPTSLYYRFNPSLAHIYFQLGEVHDVNRWLAAPDSVSERFYPFDFLKGRKLHASLHSSSDTAHLVYDHSLLYETARYLADIVAREGMMAPVMRWAFDGNYDIRLTFMPASDRIVPFALIAAVLEFNDQNSSLPPEDQYNRPGWQDTDQGSRLREIKNRNNFFARAEETVIQEGGFFPL
jgi:hypothetical protein